MRTSLKQITAAAVLVVGGLAAASPSGAAAPPTPWIVSLGDSYISGEGGRWAGNTNLSPTMTDAGGPGAYHDAGTSESIPGCHRSTAAEIHVGVVNSVNLACSGAETSSDPYVEGEDFKPGLDFYDDGAGHKGQALMLQEFASTHPVRMVQVSIGGNDFGFAGIVEQCLIKFMSTTGLAPDYCHDDPEVTAHFTADNVARVTDDIRTALANVKTAMANAGYKPAQYTIMVQTYPSPLPAGSGIRYGENVAERHVVGGCEFWNADADWASAVASPTINGAVRAAAATAGSNVKLLDVARAFDGNRLCETGVGTLEEKGLLSWQTPGASDQTEWIQRIRVETGVTGTPYYIQESLHPNWWGQLALRNCVRQAWNNGKPRGGMCVNGVGTNLYGEPNMTVLR